MIYDDDTLYRGSDIAKLLNNYIMHGMDKTLLLFCCWPYLHLLPKYIELIQLITHPSFTPEILVIVIKQDTRAKHFFTENLKISC